MITKTRFEYVGARTLEEAVETQARRGAGTHYLAAGTDLYLGWKNGAAVVEDVPGLVELEVAVPRSAPASR